MNCTYEKIGSKNVWWQSLQISKSPWHVIVFSKRKKIHHCVNLLFCDSKALQGILRLENRVIFQFSIYILAVFTMDNYQISNPSCLCRKQYTQLAESWTWSWMSFKMSKQLGYEQPSFTIVQLVLSSSMFFFAKSSLLLVWVSFAPNYYTTFISIHIFSDFYPCNSTPPSHCRGSSGWAAVWCLAAS